MKIKRIEIDDNDVTYFFDVTGDEPFSRVEFGANGVVSRDLCHIEDSILKFNGQ